MIILNAIDTLTFKPTYLPSPLMPEAPRSKQFARKSSTGSDVVFFVCAIFAFSSRFSLAVAAIITSRTTLITLPTDDLNSHVKTKILVKYNYSFY